MRTVEELNELIAKMRRLLDEIDGALVGATETGVVELHLDGVTKGDRALELLAAFAPNVKHSVEKERIRRGEY